MKSLTLRSFEQDMSIRPAPSAASLIVEHHKVVDVSGNSGYIYSRIKDVDHILTGAEVDDAATTAAVPGSAIAVDIANRTWDTDYEAWKIEVLRTAGSASTGATYVSIYGRLSNVSTG